MAEQNLFSFVPLCHQKHGVETDRSRVTTLQFQSQNVVLQTVLHLGQTSPYQCGSIRAQLASGAYDVLCSSIRDKIVSEFPLMVTDELLWLLVPPHTKNLDLSRCCNVSWEGLSRVLRRCHNLRSLTLADLGPDCHMTFDLCSIPQACPHLTFLNLASSEVDDWVVWEALRLWPYLSHLDLSYCNNLTDDCFHLPEMEEQEEEKEEDGPVLTSGTSVCSQRNIKKSHPGCKLVSVDISGCVYLTTKSIRHLTELCGPTLQALNMGFTGVDCSALWFLCGYSLSTAVQLAVAVDNNQVTGGNQGACPPMQDNRLLSPDLIHKILAGELHHGNQQPITIGLVNEEREGESSRERAFGQVSEGGEDALKHVTEMESNNSMTPLDSCEGKKNSSSSDQSEPRPEIQASNSQSVPGTCNSTDQSEAKETMSSDTILDSLSLDDVELIVPEKATVEESLAVQSPKISSSLSVTDTQSSSDGSCCLTTTSHQPKNAWGEEGLYKEDSVAVRNREVPSSLSDSDTPLLNSSDGSCSSFTSSHQPKNAWGEEELYKETRPSERPQKLKTKPRKEKTFQLQRFQPNITSLDMSGISMSGMTMNTGSDDIGNACIKAFVSANRNLRKLSLTWKDIRDETVEFIGQHAKDLRYLSMIDCDRTSPFSLACLAQNCNKLEYLDVKGMSFIGDAGLVPLVVNNRQLQTLSLAECNITDRALDKISGVLGEGVSSAGFLPSFLPQKFTVSKFELHNCLFICLSQLTCLDLSWCEEITDSGLSGVVGACVNLQQLSLRQCLSTAHTLVRLGENCRHLRSLMMSGVEGMSDGVLVSMVESLGLLEELDVSWNLGLTDVSICRVLVCCPRLRDARLAGLKRITSKPFLPIISDLARWRRCQSLLKLKEKERRVFEEEGEETWSSDEEFEDLYIPHRSASYAPCLHDLDLEYSDSVNDDYLAEIVAVCHGTLRIRDYYGEQIQPKWTGTMHFFM
ncbi:PREDICTED: LOW QUALITY PROTEIN: uncharacterized protein LOC109468526 [Branchiostoma belcheri]|uniref:LOW QUALITY PROTEIN: uncharacterized protein LOC109468526 n=1 Tax=Branchiostoma belcheri TaxID=7741 RepID=A0A6P4YUJ9_BRABE|nr:PREDICTED: LOW QUALITY PROTEIN: uncharacterized protein LOC109468526 [Branchiostoma belcheri]